MDESTHVALALVRSANGWLVSRRSGGRVFAGLWEFPGGRMEPGESPKSAAQREVEEETGLVVEPLAELGEVWTVHAGQRVTLHLVHCRPAGGEASPRDSAVLEVRWVPLAQLADLPMPPANAEIIEQLRSLER